MRYPIKDKFWGWRMDPFGVFAYWDSKENQPQLTLTLTVSRVRAANIVRRPCSDSSHVTVPHKLSFYYHYYYYLNHTMQTELTKKSMLMYQKSKNFG